MKIIALIFATLFFHSASADQKLFEKANGYYQQQQYSEALTLYDSLIAQRYNSAELFYNAGNCHFKLGNIPEAILNYERALRINPADKDTRFNLQFAQSKTIDKIVPAPELFVESWYDKLSHLAPVDFWSIRVLVCIFLSAALLVLFTILRSPTSKKLVFTCMVLFFLAAIFSYAVAFQVKKESMKPEGIVFSKTAYVKSSPDTKSIDLFILHEGAKVEVLDSIGTWRKVKIADGNEGWMLRQEYKAI